MNLNNHGGRGLELGTLEMATRSRRSRRAAKNETDHEQNTPQVNPRGRKLCLRQILVHTYEAFERPSKPVRYAVRCQNCLFGMRLHVPS